MTIAENPIVTAESACATLESSGEHCPHCDSSEVTEQASKAVENARYQEMTCQVCGVRWTNVWQLTRVLVFGQGADPDTFVLPDATTNTAPSLPAPVSLPKVRTDPNLWTQQADGSWQKTLIPRTLGDVWEDIAAKLPAYDVNLEAFDYAGPIYHQERTRPFPQDYRWLTCFAVRGTSEGWYVHVVLVHSKVDATVLETLYLAKTFEGWETALALVNAVTRMLDL